jgi:hypothetical protein
MSWVKSVRLGVWNWVSSVAVHVAPLLVVFGVLFWKPAFVKRTARLHDETDRLLARIFVLIFAMALLSVFVLKVTQFKDRWLQPLFVPLTILLVGVARDSLAPNAARLKWLLALGLIATLGAGTLSSGRLLFTERRGRRDVLNAPFTKLAADLAGPGERADCILAEGYWLAGNLRLRFPGKQIYNYQCYPPDAGVGHRCLVVWDASQRPQPPAVLTNFAREFTGGEAQSEPIYVEELWKYHRSKSMRLGYWELTQNRPLHDTIPKPK